MTVAGAENGVNATLGAQDSRHDIPVK